LARLVGILLLALLLASAGGPRAPKRPGNGATVTLVAKVVDAQTGRPVDCCYLIVLGTKWGTISDSCGIARWECPTEGKWTIKFCRVGYVDTTRVMTFDAWQRDTLRCAMRLLFAKVPPCNFGDPGYQ